MDKKPALGKGLSALIPDATVDLDQPRSSFDVDIDLLEPNIVQPRARYDDTRLDELARSIASRGIIQPIVVRKLPADAISASPRYQIVAGERRWRAAQRAGLHRVPVILNDVAPDDRRQQLEIALIENLQRDDLNPIEEATAYQRLVEEFHVRQEDIAAAVGKDRATIANVLRLLKLPADLQGDVAAGALSMGHARALVSLTSETDQRRIARDVIARGLSVRETESLVKREVQPKPTGTTSPAQADVHTRAAEEQLRLSLGTRVEIRRRGKGGTLAIAFANEDELQRIYERLTERR